MKFAVAETVYGFIDEALKTTLSVGTVNVMLGLGALIGTMWLLSFTMRGITWLWMGMTVIFQDVVTEMLKVAAIAGLAFNVGWYIETIVPFVTQAPAWMGSILSGQDGSQANQIDLMVSTYVTSLLDLISAMNFSFWDMEFKAIVLGSMAIMFYIAGGIPFIATAIITMVIIKFASTLLLVLGPLFIIFSLFDSTRHWFWNWVSNLAGFMLAQVMFSVIFSLELNFIYKFIIKNGHIDSSIEGLFSMMIFFVVFLAIMTEIPNYAASIMGGTPVGGSGFLKTVTGLRPALKAANFFRKKLPKPTGNSIQ